jgi:dihydroxyacetone kinase-like protein
MVKILNSKESALNELINGVMAAQPGKFVRMENLYSYVLYKSNIADDRVQIVISGGGGYGPLFPGFIGEGLADAVCFGDFNCAPNAYALYTVAKTINRGKGILFLTNNFTGDYLNNDMAKELLHLDGIESQVSYASDDIFSAKGEPKDKRGGLCGIGTLIKIASSAANKGLNLNDVYRVVQKANDRIRSLTVCLNQENMQMEFGNGFSGEAPTFVNDFVSADDLAANVIKHILKELKEFKNSRLYFTVNRMIGMSYLEGYVVLQSIKRQLEELGYVVGGCAVGGYFDAYNSNGCIISILAADDELEQYLNIVTAYDFTV